MMDVAILIPMTSEAAGDLSLWPNDWPTKGRPTIRWPEMCFGAPRLQEDAAQFIQDAIEADQRAGVERVAIVTRSDAVFYRIRRMLAEGAALDVAVYMVNAEGQTRHAMNRYGNIVPWPAHLFEHIDRELGCILRARRKPIATPEAT